MSQSRMSTHGGPETQASDNQSLSRLARVSRNKVSLEPVRIPRDGTIMPCLLLRATSTQLPISVGQSFLIVSVRLPCHCVLISSNFIWTNPRVRRIYHPSSMRLEAK